MNKQNVITVNDRSYPIAKKQLPYGNNFVQETAEFVQDEIVAKVRSNAGQVYICYYNEKCELLHCN